MKKDFEFGGSTKIGVPSVETGILPSGMTYKDHLCCETPIPETLNPKAY